MATETSGPGGIHKPVQVQRFEMQSAIEIGIFDFGQNDEANLSGVSSRRVVSLA